MKKNRIINQQHEQEMAPVDEASSLIKDDELIGLYHEILETCRKDRDEIDYVLGNFLDMVMNGNDASKGSKEAIVELMKTKSDIADKMARVADMMTKIKIKEKSKPSKYVSAKQNNVIIETNKRELLKDIQKLLQENQDDE